MIKKNETNIMGNIIDALSKVEKKISFNLRTCANLEFIELSSELSYKGQVLGSNISKDTVGIIVKHWTHPFKSTILMFDISSDELYKINEFVDIALSLLEYVERNRQDFDKEKMIEFFQEKRKEHRFKSLELVNIEVDLD